MELNKDNMKKISSLIVLAVILYLGIQHLDIVLEYLGAAGGLLFPFILGAAIAFVLNVPMKFIEEHVFGKSIAKGNKAAKRLARPVSLVMAILFFILVLMIVVLVVAPEMGTTIVNVAKQIEKNIPQLQKWLEENLKAGSPIVEWANSIDFQPEKVLNSIVNVLKSGVNNVLTSTISVTVGIVSTAVNVGIGFIFSFYVLLQKERLTAQIKKAFRAIFKEKTYHYINHVCSLANRIFSSFITGQCIEAVILGSMFFVSMTILRLPYAMLVGVLIAFTALIPVFGGIIGCWVAFFLILMVNPLQALGFLALFLVLQQVEGNLIYPHVVGNSVGLPSIWVLVAVTLGGSLMGIVGMLVFIPLTSVLYTLFREWVEARLEKKDKNIQNTSEISKNGNKND